MYYVYMLRCVDNSIYTGITTNVERRMEEHFNKLERCAKYTKSHTAKKLEATWEVETRKQASKLEYYIKTLTKEQKENLIKDKSNLETYLKTKYSKGRLAGKGIDKLHSVGEFII